MKNFFDELKRRNVYKVAVAYAVGSWLVVQASSLLLATFEALRKLPGLCSAHGSKVRSEFPVRHQ